MGRARHARLAGIINKDTVVPRSHIYNYPDRWPVYNGELFADNLTNSGLNDCHQGRSAPAHFLDQTQAEVLPGCVAG